MNIDELKQRIEQKTGIPASLISGETSEEVLAYSKGLLAFKQEADAASGNEQKKPTKDLFSAWLNGDAAAIDPMLALDQIANEVHPPYPVLQDAGEPMWRPQETAKSRFVDFMNNNSHIGNPFVNDPWHPIY